MSEKKITSTIKLQIVGGSASPGPPVGPRLGSKGIKTMPFCKEFNEKTQDRRGKLLNVILLIFDDKSFDFIIKGSPVSTLIKEALNIEKGSGEPNRKKIGTLSKSQLKQMALLKKEDTNSFDIEAVMKSIAGTARSMGVTITV